MQDTGSPKAARSHPANSCVRTISPSASLKREEVYRTSTPSRCPPASWPAMTRSKLCRGGLQPSAICHAVVRSVDEVERELAPSIKGRPAPCPSTRARVTTASNDAPALRSAARGLWCCCPAASTLLGAEPTVSVKHCALDRQHHAAALRDLPGRRQLLRHPRPRNTPASTPPTLTCTWALAGVAMSPQG